MGAFDDYLDGGGQGGGAFDNYLAQSPTQTFTSRPRTSAGEAFFSNAADSATFGFGDELVGLGDGIGAAATGGNFSNAYHRRVWAARDRLERARRERPGWSMAGGFAGAIAPALVTGGIGAAANAGRLGLTASRLATPVYGAMARRGLPGLGAQMGVGAAGGAVGGAVYGAGAADSGDRGMGALVGGGTGLALGGLAPPVFQGAFARNALLRGASGAAIGGVVGTMAGQDPLQSAAVGAGVGVAGRPVFMAGRNQVRQMMNPDARALRSQTGAFLGVAPTPEEAAVPAEAIPENTVRGIDKLMGRQQMDVAELSRRIDAADDEPAARILADVGGDQFERKADMLANAPGRSGPIAQRIAEERVGDAPDATERDFRELLGVRETPTSAAAAIREGERTAGGLYGDLEQKTASAEVLANRIRPLMQTSKMQRALATLADQEEDVAALALARGQEAPPSSVVRGDDGKLHLAENVSTRTLLDLKGVIDDQLDADANRLALNPKGKRDQRINDDYRHAYVGALDDALPGYAGLRGQRGDLYTASRALETGDSILNMRPDEVRALMRETVDQTGRRRPTSAFEKRMYQTAVVDGLLKKVFRRASDESGRWANPLEALKSREVKDILRAVFDDSADVENVIKRLIERSEMVRRTTKWQGNSATFSRAAQAGDSFLDTLATYTDAARGGAGGVAAQAGRDVFRQAIASATEKNNDALGRALFAPIDDGSPESRRYLRALMRELRLLENARMERARGAPGGAITAAVGGGAFDENN